jgi:hypothetical protein
MAKLGRIQVFISAFDLGWWAIPCFSSQIVLALISRCDYRDLGDSDTAR